MQKAFAQTDSIDIKLQTILAEKNAAIRIDSSNNLMYGATAKLVEKSKKIRLVSAKKTIGELEKK
jgi:hypothetical protein